MQTNGDKVTKPCRAIARTKVLPDAADKQSQLLTAILSR